MVIQYRCGNCKGRILDKHKYSFLCIPCLSRELPFGNENDNTFYTTNSLGSNTYSNLENYEISLSKTVQQQIKNITQLILANTDPDNANSNFCNYYSVKKFTKNNFKNNFSIFHLNIASLQLHIDDLTLLLNSLKHDFDIVSISETKLRKNSPPTVDINIPNYHYEHTPSEAEKGGTLIYISDKHIYKPRPDLAIYQSKAIESTFIEIINKKGKNTIIGNIYRHHTISHETFTNLMKPVLDKLSKEGKPCYLSGDFNVNLLSINKDKHIEQFFDKLTDNQFMPLITTPTRITSNTKSLIDNIYFNQFSSDIISGNLTVGISDHMPQFCIIPSKIKVSENMRKTIYRRNFKKFSPDMFMNEFNQHTFSAGEYPDVNKYTANFIQVIDKLLDKHAPVKKLNNKQLKQQEKPWINNEILKKIKLKDKTYKQFKNANNQAIKEEFESKYKQLKNNITKSIRQNKQLFYQDYFQRNSQNAKKLWAGVNNIIHTKTTNKSTINCIEQVINNNKCNLTNPKDIANAFNNHYTSVANKLLQKRKFAGNKHFTHYLNNSNTHTFMTNPTTPHEIEDTIKLINTTKSTGPNSIPNKIIKAISNSISAPISTLCNISFTSGIFPDILKISKVIPIHKKGSKLEVVNYRPISLLSNINRILETLMFKRLYSFLETYKCIYKLQFGFRNKHSTNHALLSMTQQIREAMDNGDTAVGVFVDFQKAFDTVNHAILLKKMEHYGVRGTPNMWFKSYLKDRYQYVSIDGSDSEHLIIEHGVPQGSVLGPLLFLVYINDLHTCIKHCTTRHFADDTNILHTINKTNNTKNSINKLNIDLKSLTNWLLANKISLNAAKTELIFFRKKGLAIPNYKIKLNGVNLENSSEIKYVGIIFDEHLTFDPQRSILHSKLKRANNLLSISKHYVPRELLLQIYYGQFYSHLQYGCQLWGMNDYLNSKVLTQQKRAIRTLSSADFHAHSDPLFAELKLLKLPDIIKLNNIIFVHNVLNNRAPIIFENFFNFFKRQQNYNTINNPNSKYSIPKGSLELPKTSIRAGKKNIKYLCSDSWNTALKDLSRKYPNLSRNENWWRDLSIQQLKKLLKMHFIENYQIADTT